jgi:hypothetical protein
MRLAPPGSMAGRGRHGDQFVHVHTEKCGLHLSNAGPDIARKLNNTITFIWAIHQQTTACWVVA